MSYNKSVEDELTLMGANTKQEEVKYLDKFGKQAEEYSSVAKSIEHPDGSTTYHIKYRRGQLFDPYGIDELKANAIDTTYKKVNRHIYENYLKYLQTRQVIHFLTANREYMKGE